jgi:hypothetical protein
MENLRIKLNLTHESTLEEFEKAIEYFLKQKKVVSTALQGSINNLRQEYQNKQK